MLTRNKIVTKTILALLIFIGLAVLAPKIAVAHSPGALFIDYSINTETLNLNVFHQVNDNTTHYINLVEIWKNNQLNMSEIYDSQPSLNEFNYSYVINATTGDELKVKITCNLGGSLTRILIVGETPTESVPASYACMTILALFTLGGIVRRRRNRS